MKNNMDSIKFIYAAGAMGFYGEGHWFHRPFNFPYYPFITKTLTLSRKIGVPFAVIPFGKSVWNKVSLNNPGIVNWKHKYDKLKSRPNFLYNTISIYPYNQMELDFMITQIKYWFLGYANIEVNMSCPNTNRNNWDEIPLKIKKYDGVDIWVKLNYKQNPLELNLSNIKGIRLNSIPTKFGGVSGKWAQDKNWKFIQEYNKYVDISGCSWTTEKELLELVNMGCKEISIGSVIITNPMLVEKLPYLQNNP